MEATKAAKPQGKGKPTNVSKADVALSHINKLYAIERKIKALSVAERYRIRQELSVPRLKTLKTWLEANAGKVAKGTLTRTAMDYTLNQWPTLVGYCERGDLQISNVLAENAIRPFAVGRNYLHPIIMQGSSEHKRYFQGRSASGGLHNFRDFPGTGGVRPSGGSACAGSQVG
ncbi:ISPpu15, transposase [Marinobacter sp. ELB17]|nr:ISPpu15, transposase [Marinobacter sp. ELB17]EAZ98488.1 ISPpu15, transposase [Marinobacter sp. ELB17]